MGHDHEHHEHGKDHGDGKKSVESAVEKCKDEGHAHDHGHGHKKHETKSDDHDHHGHGHGHGDEKHKEKHADDMIHGPSGHEHSHEHGADCDDCGPKVLTDKDVDDTPVPDWKKKALAMGDKLDSKAAPFGGDWNMESTVSASGGHDHGHGHGDEKEKNATTNDKSHGHDHGHGHGKDEHKTEKTKDEHHGHDHGHGHGHDQHKKEKAKDAHHGHGHDEHKVEKTDEDKHHDHDHGHGHDEHKKEKVDEDKHHGHDHGHGHDEHKKENANEHKHHGHDHGHGHDEHKTEKTNKDKHHGHDHGHVHDDHKSKSEKADDDHHSHSHVHGEDCDDCAPPVKRMLTETDVDDTPVPEWKKKALAMGDKLDATAAPFGGDWNMESNVAASDSAATPMEVDTDHDHSHTTHGAHDHGHSHEHMEHPGKYSERPSSSTHFHRDFEERAFTVGLGGPVGSGKTALMLALCRKLRFRLSLGAVTNDIFTREDGEFLTRKEALPKERIMAVETGGCPHAAIREDISANLHACEILSATFDPLDIILLESGGDNLAANFSPELADFTIYVIDVAGGDKVPRKGGPGVTQSDVLVINKTDLAEAVGASLDVMRKDSKRMRGDGPTIFAQAREGLGEGVDEIVTLVLEAHRGAVGITK